MESVQTLIDKALPLCGWQKQNVAARIGAKPQRIPEWSAGRKPIPPAKYYALARIVYPEDEAKRMATEYLKTVKMPPGFEWLLRLGNALKSGSSKRA